MFKHILVPTDGSELSQETARAAVRFAQSIGARITGYHAKPDLAAAYFYGEEASTVTSLSEIDQQIDREVERNLSFIRDLCQQAGVPSQSIITTSNSPYEGIVEAAGEAGADLIFMASHGRKGIRARILGSETLRTLTHSSIPVLVYSYGEKEMPRDLAGR